MTGQRQKYGEVIVIDFFASKINAVLPLCGIMALVRSASVNNFEVNAIVGNSRRSESRIKAPKTAFSSSGDSGSPSTGAGRL